MLVMFPGTRPIVFDTFAIERTYKASPARVFEAWRDPEKKRRWFAEGKGFVIDSYELDFREGEVVAVFPFFGCRSLERVTGICLFGPMRAALHFPAGVTSLTGRSQ